MAKSSIPQSALAAAIQRSLLAKQTPAQTIQTCFACGRTYGKGNGQFCSAKCRAAFDMGLPPYGEPARGRGPWRVFAGPDTPIAQPMPASQGGCLTKCTSCRKHFASKGLRCCSPECERQCRENEANLATMAEVGMEIPKPGRACQCCGKTLPRWRPAGKGAVRKTQKYCSQKCQRQSASQNKKKDADNA